VAEIKGPVAWFRPMVRIDLGGHGTTQIGSPFKNEEKARAHTTRIGKALLSAGIGGAWMVGIGRSYNRNAVPSTVAWADPHGTKPPPLPEPKP